MKLEIITDIIANCSFLLISFQTSDETKLETKKQLGQSLEKQGELEEQKCEVTKKNAANYVKVEGKLILSNSY